MNEDLELEEAGERPTTSRAGDHACIDEPIPKTEDLPPDEHSATVVDDDSDEDSDRNTEEFGKVDCGVKVIRADKNRLDLARALRAEFGEGLTFGRRGLAQLAGYAQVLTPEGCLAACRESVEQIGRADHPLKEIVRDGGILSRAVSRRTRSEQTG